MSGFVGTNFPVTGFEIGELFQLSGVQRLGV
jgi:hypothetical protein